MSCACKGNEASSFEVLDYDTYQSLAVAVGFPATIRGANIQNVNFTEQKLFLFDRMVTVAAGNADGSSGCVTLPRGGIPVKMCWEITGNINLPAVDVQIHLTFSVGSNVYYDVTYRVQCTNVVDVSTCNVSLVTEQVGINGIRGCSWSCLKNCAPSCISCGTNKWCWAACAASCVVRCC